MKLRILLCLLPLAMAFALQPPAKSLHGAWLSETTIDGTKVTQVLLLSGNYFAWTSYKTGSGEFLQTKGGNWNIYNDVMEFTYEFNNTDTAQVGTTEKWTLTRKDNGLQLKNKAGNTFQGKALDQNVATDLTGAWLMAGRKQDDKITRRDTTTPRKTMKILTGNRFQWIAYNTETKQFSGTGGGTYTAKDSIYTETIEFFSRDNKRVGAQLQFNYDVQGNDWHHSGKSSAGEPLYEIWAKREQ